MGFLGGGIYHKTCFLQSKTYIFSPDFFLILFLYVYHIQRGQMFLHTNQCGTASSTYAASLRETQLSHHVES